MKDKIFMTFLCVAVFGVTNAMGAVGDGPGSCKVQAEVRPEDVERYGEGDDTSVWLKGDLLFISDNEALRCGGENCDDGVEFKVDFTGYVFRCTVTGGTGEWQKVELGVDVPFCEDSEIKVFGVRHAGRAVVTTGNFGETFNGDRYVIDPKGFCVDVSCVSDYRYIDGKCVHTECTHLIESGKATGWDVENDACQCKDTANAEWRDYNCVCKDTANADMGEDGMCVCKDDGMEFDENGKCVNKVAKSNAKTGGPGDQNKVSPDNSAKDSAKNDIETLGKWLDAETEKFERSKWRDAEGKFNTARLASDSIAGVVLGTAGGLISSKVIKKKQVENGFEDIKCTIGSQEVADWGDEFQVGIQ